LVAGEARLLLRHSRCRVPRTTHAAAHTAAYTTANATANATDNE